MAAILLFRLQACLVLQTFYKDVVKNLRETLGSTNTASQSLAQSVSSLDTPQTRPKVQKRAKLPAPPSVVSGSGKKFYLLVCSFRHSVEWFVIGYETS